MTRRFTLITALAGLALVLEVPVASGGGRSPANDPATVAQQTRGVALDRHYGLGRFAADPATDAQQLRGEALDRHYGLGRFAPDPATVAQRVRGEALDRYYGIGNFEEQQVREAMRAAQARAELDRKAGITAANTGEELRRAALGETDPATTAQMLRGEALDRHYGLGAYAGLDRSSTSAPTVEATTSGRDLEWPQIGVALGIGVVLLLGVFLTLRLIHFRPLVH